VNAGGILFLVVAGAFLVALPRRSAVIPLLLAAAYTTRNPVVELGPANLSVLRILVVIGMIRVVARGERVANGVNAIDRLVFAWATLLIGMSLFHTSDAWTFRMGMVLGEVGVYVLCRIFIQDAEDVRRLFKVLCVALVPLAVLLLMEMYTARNYFDVMGALSGVNMRDGQVRAYGPFGHPILAGTVGATCLPMALLLWRTHRASALMGWFAAAGIVFASTSSGPVMMVAFTCIGLLMWHVRNGLGLIRWGTVAAIVGLQMVMKDPVYFLMARIDLTGSSTGWHRAQLVRSSIAHLGEWWAVGTDYTRHWMPTGIHANEIHTDITNHFLGMGVMGGLPLMTLFVLMLCVAFRVLGTALRQKEGRTPEREFLIWTLGSMLFGQVMNFWSISLFDQSVSFFYLILAAIGGVHRPVLVTAKESLADVAARWKPRVPAVSAPAPVARTGAIVPDAAALGVRRWGQSRQPLEMGRNMGNSA
jgi:hypothetical protein